MNIIILVRIIEDSDNRGSDNRGCTVLFTKQRKKLNFAKGEYYSNFFKQFTYIIDIMY